MPDIIQELKFKTSRSGGKGGQNVNKVETRVDAYWHVDRSEILSEEQKKQVKEVLGAKLTKEGVLIVKSQVYRTQLENRNAVIEKINKLLQKAMAPVKKRKATKPGKAARLKRLENKKNYQYLNKAAVKKWSDHEK